MKDAAPALTYLPEERLGERLFRVAPDVYRIPLPTDFPVGDVNVYYLDGPEPCLIDTGVAGKKTLEGLADALDLLGRGIAGIRTLLLSHVHVDHAGSARAIRDASRCRVLLHPRGHWRMVDLDRVTREEAGWWQRFMLASGFGEDTAGKYFSFSKVFSRYTQDCPDLEPIVAGDRLTLAGGRTIRSFESFGHCTNHVVFLLEDAGLLFTADHLLPTITANPTLEAPLPEEANKPRPLGLYQDALRRTAAIGARAACPGHGLPFEEIGLRCEVSIAHQIRRAERVLEIVRQGGHVTRKALSLAVFGQRRIWDIYLTLSEIQAAVEWLEDRGDLTVETDEQGVERFAASGPGGRREQLP